MQVENMTSPNGNKVANQFIIRTKKGYYFQSYNTLIAFQGYENGNRVVRLDINNWDYSKTTAKYRNIFLDMTTKAIKEYIADGRIELVNLKELSD